MSSSILRRIHYSRNRVTGEKKIVVFKNNILINTRGNDLIGI